MYRPKFEDVSDFCEIHIDGDLWKFKGNYDFNDLMQECYIVYLRCEAWYYNYCDLDEKIYFVFKGYFMESVRNTLHTLNHKHKFIRNKRGTAYDNMGIGKECEDTALSILIEDAPSEVKEVLQIIFNAPQEFFKILGLQGSRCPWSNLKFCKIIGVSDRKIELLKKIKKYLYDNIVEVV